MYVLEPKEGIRFPGSGVTVVVNRLTWVLGTELGASELVTQPRRTMFPPHVFDIKAGSAGTQVCKKEADKGK